MKKPAEKKPVKDEMYILPVGQRHFGQLERDAIKNVGWYMHYVFDDKESPFGTNIHTHGISENFNHMDVQLCMRVPQDIAHGIMWNTFRIIKSGTRLEPGKEYDDILQGYKVKAILAKECGRDVIRIVLPNKLGSYTGIYAAQLLNTGRENIN